MWFRKYIEKIVDIKINKYNYDLEKITDKNYRDNLEKTVIEVVKQALVIGFDTGYVVQTVRFSKHYRDLLQKQLTQLLRDVFEKEFDLKQAQRLEAIVKEEIGSEKFIDKLVKRIKDKQLGI